MKISGQSMVSFIQPSRMHVMLWDYWMPIKNISRASLKVANGHLELQLDDARVKDISLAEIENLLRLNGQSLANFPPMPIPNQSLLRNLGTLLMSEELNYDRELLRTELESLISSLTCEQREIYDTVMNVVHDDKGGIFFVNGFGGSGKTYIWNTLTSALRSKGDIVLAVASSGIASQLIPGGRTAHSRFGIPLDVNENSTCHIMQGSDLAELLAHTKLIIWDEAPMAHRHCFEALDRTLQDIMQMHNPNSSKQAFGGKVVVFGGDFRHILPVIPRACRQDIVLASLNASYLWSSCKVLSLTKNMRLFAGNSTDENKSIAEFADWILKIGDGTIGNIINDEEHEIQIDDDILINNVIDPIQSIVDNTYPQFINNHHNHEYFRDRAILSPKLEDVAHVNDYMLGLLPGSSLPYHTLKLKIGAPIMLLRNIDRSMGLCNGTRLILTRMCDHVIEACIMSGKFAGEKVLIAQATRASHGFEH
ncbi:helicase-like protein [Senna tora]|uniref:ATP-dependent DNA helicase n=1 Tax=Senna tora TaxID=362788 RepID=A0A834SDR8_9FABA|nr:helicase-like protein [Senna tora]